MVYQVPEALKLKYWLVERPLRAICRDMKVFLEFLAMKLLSSSKVCLQLGYWMTWVRLTAFLHDY